MKLLVFLGLFVSVFAFASADRESFFSDIDRMKAKSLRLQSENQNLETARDIVMSKRFAFGPSVTGAVGKEQSYARNQVLANNDYWKLSSNWNLFRSGGDLHALKSAKAKESAQEHLLAAEEVSEERTAGALIFRLLNVKDTVRAQENLSKVKEHALQIAQDRYKTGRISKEEVTKLEVDLSQQHARLRLARLDLEDVTASLKSIYLESISTQNWPFAETDKMPTFNGLVSQSTQKQEAQALGAELDYKSTRSSHFPTVDLNISFQESPLKTSPVAQWYGSVELRIPLWNRYDTAAQTSAQYSRFLTAHNQWLDSKFQEPIHQALVQSKWKVHFENTKDAKVDWSKSKQLYQDFERAFSLGRISTNDLLAEQNRLIDTELALSQSEKLLHEAYLESCDAVGLPLRQCLIVN